jgi:Zn-dependent peptidase ImmA (M78 family)/DNA-binding XRE family transcriptional regulator
MSKIAAGFSPEHLRMARMLKGFSLSELGKRVAASRQFIHQMESGVREPSDSILAALCEVLSIQKRFLYKNPISELKVEQCHFRKRRATTQAAVGQVLAYGSLLENFLDVITNYLELPSDENIKTLKEKLYSEDILRNQLIEDLASDFRALNGISLNAPIGNMVDLIESNGILVTGFSGVSDKVDALSFEKKYKIILRNIAKESACRQRFDLAHELGHLILHEGLETGDADTESQADYFAASLIFPRAAFLREFPLCVDRYGRLNWSNILNLKARWGFSAKAIIYRAYSLGILTASQYRSANITISKKGWSKREELDNTLEVEMPRLFSECLDVLHEHMGISLEKISDIVGYESSFVAELFCLSLNSNRESDQVVVPLMRE